MPPDDSYSMPGVWPAEGPAAVTARKSDPTAALGPKAAADAAHPSAQLQHPATAAASRLQQSSAPELAALALEGSRQAGNGAATPPMHPAASSSAHAVGSDDGNAGPPASTTCGWPDQDLIDLAHRMAQGIEVKDRYRHLKKYCRCFTGREAVRWLIEEAHVAQTEAEAVDIGNAMLQLGLLHHVSYKHQFECRSHFYRFDGTDNDEKPSPPGDRGGGLRTPNTGGGWRPGDDVARLQRRAADSAAELQVLRASDALLHEGQLRLQRSQQTIMRRLAAVASTQERSHFNTAVVALLQTAILLLLVLLLYCGHADREAAAAAAAAGGRVADPNDLAADGRLWLPALALLPALPLLFYLWEQCSRPTRRRRRKPPSGAGSAANLRAPLLAGSDGGVADSVYSSASSQCSSESGYHSDHGDPSVGSRRTSAEQSSAGSEEGPQVPDGALFEGWQDAPGLLRLKPGLGQRLTDGGDPSRIPLNSFRPIEFETDSFVGRAAIWVRHLPSAPRDLFAGKRRRSRISIQGQFKRRICAEDVITGQEFERATNMPAKWLVEQVLVKVAKAINPSVEIGPMSSPSVLVPAAAMAQGMVVSEPGQEPDITGEDTEDCRLLGPQFCEPDGSPASVNKRKVFFGDVVNRRRTFFEPDKVYTFHIFQHLVDLSKYQLDLSVYKFDLAHYVDGQPLQFMMRPRGEKARPFFAFEMWHTKLLQAAQRHED